MMATNQLSQLALRLIGEHGTLSRTALAVLLGCSPHRTGKALRQLRQDALVVYVVNLHVGAYRLALDDEIVPPPHSGKRDMSCVVQNALAARSMLSTCWCAP